MKIDQKIRSNILKISLFATGLSGIVAEYVLSTLATYFLGNSVLQWTMIVSIMLFSMGLGSRLSKYLANNLLQKFVIIEFILSVLTAYVSVLTYIAAAFSFYTGATIYLLSIAIGLLIGMEIPLVIRLNDEFESLKVNVSSILEKDYYGSLLGGIFFAFVGLPYFGLTFTPFILSAINFSVALLLLSMLWSHLEKRHSFQLSIFAGMTLIIMTTGLLMSKAVIRFGEEKRYLDKIVYSKQSKYQKIVITENQDHFWLFINGNQQLSTLDEEMYHEPLVHPVMSYLKHPKNILVLGGGDGCAVREILKYDGIQNITLVDLDPAMTDLGKSHPILVDLNKGALSDSKVQIVNQDAFNYLEKSLDYFDIIIIDLPDPKNIELSRLYSFEFYKLCYKRLRSHGLIVTQAGSPYYATAAFKCIEMSLESAGFTTVALHNQVITLGEWGWIAGSKAGESKHFKENFKKVQFDNISTKWLNKESMLLMTSFGKEVYLPQEVNIEVNTIHNPVLSKYYNKGRWDLY